MANTPPLVVSELLYRSYANLAMAHYAVERGLSKYDRTSFIIRARLLKGLTTGEMHIRSFFDDEKVKLSNGARCVYCGSTDNLSVDHIFAKAKGGSDSSDNLVCCCKTCNSSKRDEDLMEWYASKGEFPSLLLLRRYLKLVFQFCETNGIMDSPIDSLDDSGWPFRLKNIPLEFPAPSELRLMVTD
jgi:hypothetical protein